MDCQFIFSTGSPMQTTQNKWTFEQVEALFQKPLLDLLFEAHTIHRQHFDSTDIELCSLCNIKSGNCPEDCGYCSQSGHFKVAIEKTKLLDKEEVITQAKYAKEMGAKRFCMGAAWRNPPKKELPKVCEMIKEVKALGLETCVTLGMLDEEQAKELKIAGLDFYNHNLDTSPEYYKEIITTRTYDDRLNTLDNVRKAGINVCCGGILGLGEKRHDRINLLLQLANMPEYPQSVPINNLIPFEGTKLQDIPPIDNFEFIRTIATARILMPKARIRLSAGRSKMSEEMQTLCFFAGANSMWLGDKLLTADNPSVNADQQLFERLGLPYTSTEQYA